MNDYFIPKSTHWKYLLLNGHTTMSYNNIHKLFLTFLLKANGAKMLGCSTVRSHFLPSLLRSFQKLRVDPCLIPITIPFRFWSATLQNFVLTCNRIRAWYMLFWVTKTMCTWIHELFQSAHIYSISAPIISSGTHKQNKCIKMELSLAKAEEENYDSCDCMVINKFLCHHGSKI